MSDTKIRNEQITSESATDGYVLTADGAGGTDWEAPSATGSQYRQFVYYIEAGEFYFIKINTGEPVMVLQDLE